MLELLFWPPNKIVIVAVTVVLIGLAVRGFVAAKGARRRPGESHANLSGDLGERSTNFVLVLYGVATVAATLAVDVADAFLGWKSLFVVVDYVVLSYLFFFDNWFRNMAVLKLYQRITRN